MTEDRDEIIEYVRRAAPITDRAAVALIDPLAKQELLYRVLSTPVADDPVPAGRGAWPRLALAGAAAGAVALAAAVGVVVAGDGSAPPAADPPPVSVPPATAAVESVGLDGGGMKCVEEYGLATLAGRAFAFDGTVTGIAPPGGTEAGYVPVTFRVAEWFRGGGAAQVTVSMFPPDAQTSLESDTYRVGSRLLVSGEDRSGGERLAEPVAWYCGFTRTYSAETADQWRDALR